MSHPLFAHTVRLTAMSALAAGLMLSTSCNRRVFQEVKNSCDTTLANDIEVPTEKAADILIVVDNSGSMLEEQQNLVNNFLNQNPAECPLQADQLKNIPAEFKNPARELYTGNGPLAKCGFIQLLAAFENDFRVGVITTNVGLCDNAAPAAQGGAYCGANPGAPECNGDDPNNKWGFRPQRGCLQPDGPPGATRKLISAADLKDDDPNNDDFASRFRSTLENIRTFGSPFERGLDAMNIFLDPASTRAPGCEGDLETFRRDNAALVVIFLTDEEDCSHGLGDSTFDDELDADVCGEYLGLFLDHDAKKCYSEVDTLSPVSLYADALKEVDPKVKVAVIAGGLGEPGNVEPAGCLVGGDGKPADGCFESGGLSNANGAGPNQICGPDTADQRGGLPCCVADPGGRYFDLAKSVENKTTDSICNSSFRGTMLDIAAFIAAVDFVELDEPPVSPSAILVQLTKAGEKDPVTLAPLPAGANCATDTGWRLENGTRVVLCGGARPGPGDEISVRAKGAPPESCAAGAE
jgi:hypothetical protein